MEAFLKIDFWFPGGVAKKWGKFGIVVDDFVSNTGSEYVESDESHNVEWSRTIPQDKKFSTVITKFPGSMFKPITEKQTLVIGLEELAND